MRATAEIEAAIPDYEITRELGRGAMGIVYQGRHRQLERPVAIKSLPAAFAADDGVRERFVAEAKVLASLDHPHVVIVHDFVDRDGQCLLVMEELPGGTLWERFVEQGMTPPVGTALAVAASAGLAHAHERGVLHRDVKPENLMFTASGQIKVTDFGIAKVVNGAAQMATVDGSVLGTPAYMSPEQANGDGVGPTTDVYATATMLYELLSGRLPFASADSPMAMLVRRLTNDAPPISDIAPHVPTPLADAVMHGLARDADDRPSDIETWAVEVASAATAAWGPAWLEGTGVVVSGSDRVDAATRTTAVDTPSPPPAGGPSTHGGASRSAETIVPESTPVAPDQPGRTDPTITPSQPTTPTPAPRDADTVIPGAAPAPASEEIEAPAAPPTLVEVRPVVQAHDRGADLGEIDPRSLIRISDIVDPPKYGPLVALVGLALLALAVLLGLTGTDPEAPTGDLAAGTATIAGADPTGDDAIELDFSEPVAVTADAASATLELSMLGIPLGSVDTSLDAGGGSFDSSLLEWTFGGAGRGELILEGADGSVTTQTFAATSARAWYLSGPGIVAIVVGLFAISYTMSALRPVRRGRPFRIATIPPLAIAGALIGISVVALAATAAEVEPTVDAVTISVGLAAISMVILGEGIRRTRRASRVRKRRRAIAG